MPEHLKRMAMMALLAINCAWANCSYAATTS